MSVRRTLIASIAASALLVTSGLAWSADEKKPVGTVSIDETQFAVIIGGSIGGGKLKFEGKTYDFKIKGLTVGANVGASKMQAEGQIFDLKDVAKFPGTYVKFDADATWGGGLGYIYLKNDAGVVMKLKAMGGGFQLNVASASGVKIEMK